MPDYWGTLAKRADLPAVCTRSRNSRGIIGFDLPFFREYLLEFLGEYPAKPARGPKPC